MRQLTNRILILSSIVLISAIGVSFFLYSFYPSKRMVCGTVMPEAFCGTENLSEEAREGRQVFNANCAACHKLDNDMTGPALAYTDSTLLWNWMTMGKHKIDTSRTKEMGVDWHKYQWSQVLTEQEINELYDYLIAR
ncbi:cytochrome c [Subsaxibacter sp. CAU 1640]|uniref:c-type cytochrome n=1 Tax=Subsaxibacter sp. CAU 1640 TaxID=2933271 RepID=UPI0020029FBF|nr:cytochrome c [Subsaxibacter sp. CAU 1640]MCK7591703.1 cytochrome c [Subsaxibacter sp. CAU 1640]